MTEVYEDEQYRFGGGEINTRMMCEVACTDHGRSGHNGSCVVFLKRVPPHVFWRLMEKIKGTDLPQPYPDVVADYETAAA